MKRVPHCTECEFVKRCDFQFPQFFCENDRLRFERSLGVDNLPKTSPKWCPKRFEADADLIKGLSEELMLYKITVMEEDNKVKTWEQLYQEINDLFFAKYFMNKNAGNELLKILDYIKKFISKE